MVSQQRMELAKKIVLLGTMDLNKLAPIGDLGYLNDIETYQGDFLLSTIPDAIIRAFYEQKAKNCWTLQTSDSGYRGTDHHSHCPELGLSWHVDSSD